MAKEEPGAEFLSVPDWASSPRPGYVFKEGASGLGYYRDRTRRFDQCTNNKLTYAWEDGSLPFDCRDFVRVLNPSSYGKSSGKIRYFETDKYGNVLWNLEQVHVLVWSP